MEVNEHERENNIRRRTHPTIYQHGHKNADNNNANANKDRAMKYYDKKQQKKL